MSTTWWAGGLFLASLVAAYGHAAGQSAGLDTMAGEWHEIDLAETLELAGARNLDIQMAIEAVRDAQGRHTQVLEQLLPTLAPTVLWQRNNGLVQGTEGGIVDVDKHSRATGLDVSVRIDMGSTYFKAGEASSLKMGAESALEGSLEAVLLEASLGYFNLALAHADVGIAREALRISADYASQVGRAVEAGIAFRGDQLRVQVQVERDQLDLRRAQERRRVASAHLAGVLNTDPTIELRPPDADLVPLNLSETAEPLPELVKKALAARPELRRASLVTDAASAAHKEATYGPLIPSLGARTFLGDLNGGPAEDPDVSGPSRNYAATISWRLGPGGLFDLGRMRSTEARLATARLEETRTADVISVQVVEGYTRLLSLSDQLVTAERALAAANETLRLSFERKSFGVGAVLEVIQAGQELSRARVTYATIVSDYNKTQYTLKWALGSGLGRSAE